MHSIYSREGNFEDANLVIWIDFIHFKEAIQIVVVFYNKNVGVAQVRYRMHIVKRKRVGSEFGQNA